MSSHDCRVEGVVSLKEGVDEAAVRVALSSLLEFAGVEYDALVESGDIRLEEGTLYLSVEFSGQGGYLDDDLNGGIQSLSEIAESGEWVDVMDFDTGDSDAANVPHFLGSPDEKRLGRLKYGLGEMERWIQPLIGTDSFQEVVDSIKSRFAAANENAKRKVAKPRSPSLGM